MYPSQRCNTRYTKYPTYFKMQLYLSPGYFIDKVWIVYKFQSHVALHQKYWAIFSMQVSITYEVVGVGCRLCSFDEKWLLQHHHAIMAMSKTSVWYFWWSIRHFKSRVPDIWRKNHNRYKQVFKCKQCANHTVHPLFEFRTWNSDAQHQKCFH